MSDTLYTLVSGVTGFQQVENTPVHVNTNALLLSGHLGTSTNATINGNITVTGTVDGRDVAADGILIDRYFDDFTNISVVSGKWNRTERSMVTDIRPNSARWNTNANTEIAAASARYNRTAASVETNVVPNSADWNYTAANSAAHANESSYKTIALSGNRGSSAIGADVVADSTTDTLTLCAGPNIVLLSDPTNDVITISGSAGGGGGGSSFNSSEIAAASARYNRTATSLETNVVGNTANWNSTYNQVQDSSTDLNIDSNTLVVDKSENRVGIGTAAPGALLTVAGNVSSSGTVYSRAIAGMVDDITLDAEGDIILDANGADIKLKDNGTEFGRFSRVSSDLVIKSISNNNDIVFKGVDSTATITAMTIDMSEAGKVGIGTTAPNEKLTVIGNISATGKIYNEDGEISSGGGSSFNSSEIAAASARYTRTALSVETNVVPATGSWNSTNTTLVANSARYDRTALSLETNVVSNSADWNYTAANTAISVAFDVTNNGSGGYRFNNGGFTNDDNPTLHLQRGKTYRFRVNASGHPFLIKTQAGTGTSNQYLSGVTGAGAQTGNVDFEVRHDAPRILYYQCQNHSAMAGAMHIGDATATTEVFNNSADWNYTAANSAEHANEFSYKTIALSGNRGSAAVGADVVADSTTDTLTLCAGPNIVLLSDPTNDVITISGSAGGGGGSGEDNENSYKTIALSGNRASAAVGADVVADSTTDTLTLCAGPNIVLLSDPTNDVITISGSAGGGGGSGEANEHSYKTIALSGNRGSAAVGADVVADSTTDTLTLCAGPNIVLLSDPTNDVITISGSAGGGGGGGSSFNSSELAANSGDWNYVAANSGAGGVTYQQTLTGNGSTTIFEVSARITDPVNAVVSINGVLQLPTTHYTVSAAHVHSSNDGVKDMVFTQAPASGERVDVRIFNAADLNAGATITTETEDIFTSFSTDTNYPKVKLLLHGEGTSGDTEIVDDSPNHYTVQNTNTEATFLTSGEKKYGSTSIFLSGGRRIEGDDQFANVGLLLKFSDLADGSSSFSDKSSNDHTVTVASSYPGSIASTSKSKWGTSSLSGRIDLTPDASFDVGTGDFTIEAWVAWGAQQSYSFSGSDEGRNNTPQVGHQNSSSFGIAASNITWDLTSSTVPTLNNDNFQHIAVCRGSGRLSIFIDGTRTATETGNSQNYEAPDYIGLANNGFMDSFRLTKGVDRYGANNSSITVPTTEFAESASDTFTGGGLKIQDEDFSIDGDFTIESFVRPLDITNGGVIYSSGTGHVLALSGATGKLSYDGSYNAVATTVPVVTANTWSHIAVVREDGSLTVFANGVSALTTSEPTTGALLGTTEFTIGMDTNDQNIFKGFVDEFRITDGVARYSGSTYTVPAAAFSGESRFEKTVVTGLTGTLADGVKIDSTYATTNANSADWNYTAANSAAHANESSFKTFALSGNRASAAVGADVVADSTTDTLTLCAGPNIVLLSDPTNDVITISGSAGGGGGGGDTAISTETQAVKTFHSTDDEYHNVQLLLHCEGSNNDTDMDDDSRVGHHFDFKGNSKLSSTQKKFGSTSLFTGTSDNDHVEVDSDDTNFLELGTGDFTLEFWLYWDGVTGYQTVFDNGYGSGSTAGSWMIQTDNGNGRLKWYHNGGLLVTEGSDPTASTWLHYAIVRSSGTLKIYRNGIQTASASTSNAYFTPDKLSIGARNAGTYPFDGYLDEIRITKGIARYSGSDTSSANFTLPSAAFSGEALESTTVITGISGSVADGVKIDSTYATTNANSADWNYVAANSGGIAFDGSTANGVLTYKDSDEASVESNLTFDGSKLAITGNIHTSVHDYGTGADLNVDFDQDALQKYVLNAGLSADTAAANKGAGKSVVILLSAGSASRNFNWNSSWKFIGEKPASIAGNKVALLSMTCFGSNETDIICSYGVQD